ncbi:MAG: Nitrogen regulation protein NtrY [Myxococcaceae bacterium]|nr:Nitrogen regulation protein NtrY [Myxococcaceae bacterium]
MALRIPGKTELRLALVILLTAILPLVAALLLANSLFKQASAIWFDPEVGQQLDRGVDVYKDYVKAIKDDMRHQTDAIAADEVLREAAKKRNTELIEAQLDALFPRFPQLVVLSIEDADGNLLARRDRGRPVNDATERSLDVRRALSDDQAPPQIAATFAIDRKRLDELETTGTVVMKYHQLEQSRDKVYEGYVYAFAVLLALTVLMTVLMGTFLARGVTRRINRLAAAINLVAEGDLEVRVPVTGSDELTDLAHTFNRMLGEMAQSRARIEFLQRIGAWQEMAQRLAHEIKNPLTPIQLAVQECHRKYGGEDPRFRALLDTTLEIVEEEVGTLRRLVGDFSNFARLPHAELKEESLREFLRECSEQLGHLEEVNVDGSMGAPVDAANVDITWQLPDASLDVAIDRQMLRRVVVNLVRNSVQAIRDARALAATPLANGLLPESAVIGHVVVRCEAEMNRTGGGAAIIVEDDGPGIAKDARDRVFDPYYTTKVDGTGLGLAIVKKIIVEHGGSIEATRSTTLGGARFIVHLPGPRTLALAAAKEARSRALELEVGVGPPPRLG